VDDAPTGARIAVEVARRGAGPGAAVTSAARVAVGLAETGAGVTVAGCETVGAGLAVAGGLVGIEVAVPGGSVAAGAGVAEASNTIRVATAAAAEGLAPGCDTTRAGTVGTNGSGVGRENKEHAVNPTDTTSSINIARNIRMANTSPQKIAHRATRPADRSSITQLSQKPARNTALTDCSSQ